MNFENIKNNEFINKYLLYWGLGVIPILLFPPTYNIPLVIQKRDLWLNNTQFVSDGIDFKFILDINIISLQYTPISFYILIVEVFIWTILLFILSQHFPTLKSQMIKNIFKKLTKALIITIFSLIAVAIIWELYIYKDDSLASQTEGNAEKDNPLFALEERLKSENPLFRMDVDNEKLPPLNFDDDNKDDELPPLDFGDDNKYSGKDRGSI